jgi:hypothetical protein
MKIGVCSLTIGEKYKNAVKLCTKSLVQYCEIHNYTLITEEKYSDHDREYMWSKVPLIQQALNSNKYDYIVWIDGDMMIMNFDIRLEDIISLYLGNKEIMMSIDVGNQINTGFWVIKTSDYNKRLLKVIYNLPELAGRFHEQGVFNKLYEKNVFNLQKKSRIIPEVEQRLFNASLCNFVWEDFIMHFLGIRNLEYLEKACKENSIVAIDGDEDGDYFNRINWLKQCYGGIRNYRYIKSPPKIKVTVCTLYMGDKYTDETVYYGQKTIKDYCEKHNYTYVVERELIEKDLPPHWSKLALIKKLLNTSEDDYIVWLDADIMIMNQDIKIEDLIKDYMDGKDFLLCRDISKEINTGVWIVKNTEYSSSILELNLALPELRYRGYEDQDVFNQIYNRNLLQLQEKSVILPTEKQNIMNCCVGLYHWGDFLIHFFSLSKPGLTDAFANYYPDKKDGELDYNYYQRLKWLQER